MRRRIRRACEPCRHRKVKCDGGNPCDVCVGYGYSCVYANREAPEAEHVSSIRRPSPSSVSRSQEKRPSVPSIPHALEESEPQKHLYELSAERASAKPESTRFTRVDSAIAFPRSLAFALQADEPPRLQAFAWNTGTRTEHVQVHRPRIFAYVTLQDLEHFSEAYFASVNPIFDIIDRETFHQRVLRCWAAQVIDAGLEVLVCGVVALGSLFSTVSFGHEADLVEHARLTLDSTFAHSGALLSVDFVIGWILRALYLRSTTRPHVSWMASSMALHIAESVGLHQEMSEIKTSLTMSEAEIDVRRRTFWVADCLNRFFSAQYGRTKTVLQNVGCRYPSAMSEDRVDDFISLVRLMPDLCDATSTGSPSSIAPLTDGLLRLGKADIHKLPLLLLRADAVFCIYRKIRYIGVPLSLTQTTALLSTIRSALDAATALATQFQQWWTIIGVPFHSVCVLLSLDTTESLALLPRAMETLQTVATVFTSHVSGDALRTAQYLVKVAERRRRGELESLQRCLNLNASVTTGTISPNTVSSEATSDVPSFEWPTDVDLGFAQFLNESYGNEDMAMAGGLDR